MTEKKKTWTKPEFKRLGEIKDVAAAHQTPLTQTAVGKS
jgi:hypothetical protein